MRGFRIAFLILVIVQVVIAAFTAAVGSFADGGTIWERLTLVVVHPLCAVGMLVLAAPRRPASAVV